MRSSGTFGAWIGGKLDDRLGPKKVIAGSLVILLVALITILLIDRELILFVKVAPPVPGGPLFGAGGRTRLPAGRRASSASPPGRCRPPSRTLLIRLAPPSRITQHFGLFALTGKVTSFVGPLLVASITALTMNQKSGMVVLLVLLPGRTALLLLRREG